MQNTWIWVVVAVILLGGGFWWWQSPQTPASDTGTDVSIVDTGAGSDVNAGADVDLDPTPTTASVSYDGSAFSPSQTIIKKGGTVTFSGPSTMNVASGMHPTHTAYDDTARATHCAAGYTGSAPFDQCNQASSYSFRFDKVGTWGYHDHANAGAFAKIVVID